MKLVQPNAGQRIRAVVRDYVDFIGKSYGPAGQSVLIQEEHKLRAVDDGKIISEHYELENEFDNAVIKYIKEATAKTDSRAGDGTTTSAIIMGAIVEEVSKLNSNLLTAVNPNKYILEIRKAAIEAVAHIKKVTKSIKDKKDLYEIALNSSNDETIATLISDTIFAIGKDGRLSVQDCPTMQTICEVCEGMEIEKGYISPYMVDCSDTGQPLDKVVLNNPYVILVNGKIEGRMGGAREPIFHELIPIFKKVVQSGHKDILVIAEGFNDLFINQCVVDKFSGSIKPLLIENPAYGDHKGDFLKDLASVCGGVVVDEKNGIKSESLELIDLGRAVSVIAKKGLTTIINKGNKKRIADRVEQLKAQPLASDYERIQVEGRIAALLGGIAVIKVGANTQNEQETKKLKVEDAVNATMSAFRKGVIRGGGKTLDEIKTSSELFNRVLKAPSTKLKQNGEEFLDDKVFDPADVLIAGIESGVSTGLGLIQMSGIIATKREKKDSPQY